MIKKTITYENYDGVEITEDFYFHLNKAEITEMELSTAGGLETYLNKIINSKDGAKIINTFKDLIIKSYGVRSDDAKHFYKSPELIQEFTSTEAFSNLFMELATDAEKAAEFVNGIMPKDLAEQINKAGEKVVALPGAAPSNLDVPKPNK